MSLMCDEEWSLDTRCVGRRVLFFRRVDSTNNVAARLADDPANDGLAVLAAEQTAGRGQHGRRWQCRPGDGVLLSVLLFPPPPIRRPAVLTAWAAVAVCETVRRLTGLQARIKWPNDVLLRGRKVCGILIEQGRGSVVGIGLNVRQPAEHFAEAGLPHAASLTQFADADLDARAAAETLLHRMDEEYARLLDGDLATLEACWKWHVGLLGRDVIAERYDGATHRGRLLELAFDGLRLEAPGSSAVVLPPEMVRHLEPGGDD
jgi:BirA family transcriptional regulator, biotin operon repressor / biotin---[acetyl-CoA-carboxylase] ligase